MEEQQHTREFVALGHAMRAWHRGVALHRQLTLEKELGEVRQDRALEAEAWRKSRREPFESSSEQVGGMSAESNAFIGGVETGPPHRDMWAS